MSYWNTINTNVGVFRTRQTSKMVHFAKIVSDEKPLAVFAKCTIFKSLTGF